MTRLLTVSLYHERPDPATSHSLYFVGRGRRCGGFFLPRPCTDLPDKDGCNANAGNELSRPGQARNSRGSGQLGWCRFYFFNKTAAASPSIKARFCRCAAMLSASGTAPTRTHGPQKSSIPCEVIKLMRWTISHLPGIRKSF